MLEAFKYLGAGTVIERSRPEVNMTLSMVNLSGTAGAVGDKYTGLDRFGRVVDQRWTQGTTPTSAVVDRYGYTYDRNSNRLTRSNALAPAFSERYSYDVLNQLSSYTRGSGTTPTGQWSFDALGNWAAVTTNSVAQNRTANAQNEVTQVGSATLTYSRTGNLAKDEQGRTLVYDGWNRLVSVRNTANTEIARYEYDGLNRRIVEQVGSPAAPDASTAPVRDIYYSHDWQVIEERVRSSLGMIPGSASTRFIWSPVYVDALIARDARSGARTTARPTAGTTDGMDQRVYALQDANWNTTAIVSAGGVAGVAANTVFHRFVYTPYGEWQILTSAWTALAAGTTAATPWSHLFQGLEFTVMTGLSHARNRDYSASLGRFIQLDPIGFNAGDNNWYRFVENGPTGKVDPTGLVAETAWDVFNVGSGVISLFSNVAAGNVGGAVVDLAGLTYDTVATAVPGLPGGAQAAIQASRAAKAARIILRPVSTSLSKAMRATTNAAQNGKVLVRYAVTMADEAHHLIPKTGPGYNAALRRQLDCIRENAKRARIDLDSAANGVSLPTSYHRLRGGVGGDANTLQEWYYREVARRFTGVTDAATFQAELDKLADFLLKQSGKMK